MTNHEINAVVSLSFNKKRIEQLKRKHLPKTKVERQRSFYLFLLITAILCEAVDISFTFAGIVHFANTKLSENGVFLSIIVAVSVIALGIFKHGIMNTFHAQRLDDEYIPASTYVFIFIFFSISVIATYNVTPSALEFLTRPEKKESVDSVSAKYDNLLKEALAVINLEIKSHDTTANKIFSAASFRGKLSRDSRISFEDALGNKKEAQSKITSVTFSSKIKKELAVKALEDKNEAIIKKHKDWCVSFGFWLSWFFVLIEFLYFPSKWFCENYEREEVADAKAKTDAVEKEKEKEKSIEEFSKTDTKIKEFEKATEKAKVIENQYNSHIGFAKRTIQETPLEGDIVKGEGRQSDRILVMVNGNLRPMKVGDINTLIKGQSAGSKRVTHLETLKNKLI